MHCVAFTTVALDATQRVSGRGDILFHAAAIEFFAVHASGFLKWTWIADWDLRKRAAFVTMLAAAYSLPLAITSLAMHAWWPLTTFWALTANRLLDAVLREAPKGDEMKAEGYAWAGNTTLFVLAACVAGLADLSRTAVLIAGGGYFAANALSELTGWSWVKAWMTRARSRDDPDKSRP